MSKLDWACENGLWIAKRAGVTDTYTCTEMDEQHRPMLSTGPALGDVELAEEDTSLEDARAICQAHADAADAADAAANPKLKWHKKKGKKLWLAPGYQIEDRGTDDEPVLIASTRPQGVEVATVADVTDMGSSQAALLKRAKWACDGHRAGDDGDDEPPQADDASRPASQPLIWHEDYPDWVGSHPQDQDGPRYRCSATSYPDGSDGLWTPKGPSGDLGLPVGDLDVAQAACQSYADVMADCQAHADTQLKWHEVGDDWATYEDEDDACLGPPVYHCELDTDGWYTTGPDDCDLGTHSPADDSGLILAQAACQAHADTSLSWRESAPGELWVATSPKLHPSEDYSCRGTATAAGVVWWTPYYHERIIGQSLRDPAEAQALCQEHARLPAAEDEGAQPESAAAPDGVPDAELRDWPIRASATSELRAELAVKQADAHDEIDELEMQIADSADGHKRLKNLKTKEIDEIRRRLRTLSQEVRHGAAVTRRCHRQRVDGEWVYTDPDTGDELYREPAADGEQQRLCGSVSTTAEDDSTEDSPEPELAPPLEWHELPTEPEAADEWVSGPYRVSATDKLVVAWWTNAAGVESELCRSAGFGADDRQHDIDETKAACAADAAAKVVAACLDAAAAHDHLAAERPLTKADFRHHLCVGDYVAGDPEGEHYHVQTGGDDRSDGLRRVSYTDAAGRKRALGGVHKLLRDAYSEAAADNVTRLRWPAVADRHVLLSSDGRYQLHQVRGEGDSWLDAWRAELVGVLGAQNEQLNSDAGEALEEAKATCQEHAGPAKGAEQ